MTSAIGLNVNTYIHSTYLSTYICYVTAAPVGIDIEDIFYGYIRFGCTFSTYIGIFKTKIVSSFGYIHAKMEVSKLIYKS